MNRQHPSARKLAHAAKKGQPNNRSNADNLYALQRAIQKPGLLTSEMVLQLQRTIGNQAVQNLLDAQTAPTLQSAIQMSRSYKQVAGDGSGGGGNVYKMIQYNGYHIKFHPREGSDDLFFDEFHVTFENERIQDGEPKIYFDTEGNRLPSYDNTFVNKAYIKARGQKAFSNLITTAEQYAKTFISNCDRNGVGELSSDDEALMTEEYQAEKRRQNEKREEEERQFGEERRRHDEMHSKTFVSDSRGLFSNQSGESRGQQILDEAGVVKGMKKGELAPWVYIPLKNNLDGNKIAEAKVLINKIEDNALKEKLLLAIA
jgi:hypothetical protein